MGTGKELQIRHVERHDDDGVQKGGAVSKLKLTRIELTNVHISNPTSAIYRDHGTPRGGYALCISGLTARQLQLEHVEPNSNDGVKPGHLGACQTL